MIYKYTKCESVIAKIMADADIKEKNIRITDIREWIFEAVEKIGAPMQYISRESGAEGCPILKIQDYQVPIPEDLESLQTVAFAENPNGPWVPCRTNTSAFKEKQKPQRFGTAVVGPVYDTNNYTIDEDPYIEIGDKHCTPDGHQPMRYKMPTAQSQFYGVNGMKYIARMLNGGGHEEPSYFIKPGWIVLNRKEGYVKLAYKSIATDERGYPLIPDLASYQEAVYWYVMMKLSFPKFLNGSLGGHRKYNFNTYTYLQQQWNFYRNQAYAEAMMPNDGEMRTIKNEWTKLIPDWDSDDRFFRSVGERQLNYNDYYYGY